jgi:hypothetical protein
MVRKDCNVSECIRGLRGPCQRYLCNGDGSFLSYGRLIDVESSVCMLAGCSRGDSAYGLQTFWRPSISELQITFIPRLLPPWRKSSLPTQFWHVPETCTHGSS